MMQLSYLLPWKEVNEHAKNLVQELERELSKGHPLWDSNVSVIAQRIDSDEIFIKLQNHNFPYAVVHLTWSGESEQDIAWPDTQFYGSLQAWIDNCMKLDHEEYVSNSLPYK